MNESKNFDVNNILSRDECIKILINAFNCNYEKQQKHQQKQLDLIDQIQNNKKNKFNNNNSDSDDRNNESNCNNINNNYIKSFYYQIEEITSQDAIGFLGEYYKLIIRINEDKISRKFFIKSLPINKLEERKMLQKYGIFKKEITLYGTLLKELSLYSRIKWMPECYHTTDELLVLEDLIEKGYFLVFEQKDFSKDHLKACLRSLAALHASSIAYEIEHKIKIDDIYGPLLFETSVANDNDWFLAGVQCVKDVALRHPKYQSKEYQNFIMKEFLNKLNPVYEMVNKSEKYRNVVCHRDLWGRNMFFKSNQNQNQNENEDSLFCVLIDFQICRYCPPAIDVLLCIHLNLQSTLRQQILNDALKWYYNLLKNELELLKININDHITENEFFECCDNFKLWPVTYNAVASTIINLPKGVLIELRKNNPDKYQNFTSGDRSEIVLEYLETDENFRSYIFERVEELMEILLQIK